MTQSEVDGEILQKELDQIKQVVGLQEEHPYMWRWWLIQGVGSLLILPLVDLDLNTSWDPIPMLVAVCLLGFFVFVERRIRSAYEEPTTGVPGYWAWQAPVLAGILVVFLAFAPFWDVLGEPLSVVIVAVLAAILIGTGFLYLGLLLKAFNIRTADRYAFYGAGVTSLALAILIAHVSQLHSWPFTVIGLVWGSYCLGAYLYLARA